jgi:hypothetical protein
MAFSKIPARLFPFEIVIIEAQKLEVKWKDTIVTKDDQHCQSQNLFSHIVPEA